LEERTTFEERAEAAPYSTPKRLWFVGDTGYDAETFHSIRQRYGAPDLALIPIGAYEPRWFMSPMHMNPAEAVAAHRDVGAKQSIAMHWGTFQLTDEAREAPVEALDAALRAAGVPTDDFRVLAPGASFVV
jgi:L-ascorbate metabolism protein UlaG (beta-lactamase superfamily)